MLTRSGHESPGAAAEEELRCRHRLDLFVAVAPEGMEILVGIVAPGRVGCCSCLGLGDTETETVRPIARASEAGAGRS